MIIALITLLALAYPGAGIFYAFFSNAYVDTLSIAGVFAVAAAGVTVVLLWSMSFARRAKLGSAGQHTLAYKLFGGIGKLYRSSGAKAQAVAGFVFYILAGIFCSAILVYGLFWWAPGWTLTGGILLVAYSFASLMAALKKARALDAIRVGVEEIKNGNMDYVIPVYDGSDMKNIAAGINNIAEGLSSAVTKEVKAERMKTELITNISHDLKTPLTSILTYVDLLKKQGGLSGEAQKYLEVLDTKSNRLKVLTDDLFEAAKASSGDMTVNITRIELVQFMEQAIGEMSDRMGESGLAFITDLPDGKMFVCADGKLLFRVVSNVFDNVIKYALEESRVYVSMTCDEENICVIVKNISRDELNITVGELMERFVRGDSSRNTEGSGLGLAIAKDFMRLMNGRLAIEIDGDLFKVSVFLKKAA
jgi:signal transduction histidine kinase